MYLYPAARKPISQNTNPSPGYQDKPVNQSRTNSQVASKRLKLPTPDVNNFLEMVENTLNRTGA